MYKFKLWILPMVLVLIVGCSSVSFSNPKTLYISNDCSRVAGHNVKEVFLDSKIQELAKAAACGKIEKINQLVKEGADPNAAGKDGATLLFWAMSSKNKIGVEALLNAGANPNAVIASTSRTISGTTYADSVMSFAVAVPDSDYLKILLDHGGDPNIKNHLGRPILFETDRGSGVVLWNNLDLLIAKGADINATTKGGTNFLMFLAQGQRFLEIEQILNKYGDSVDINHKDKGGVDLAWYVKKSAVSPDTRQGQARERVRALLIERGVELS